MAKASLRIIETVRRYDRIGRALELERPTERPRIRVERTLDLVPVLAPERGRPDHLEPVYNRLDRVPFERVLLCVSLPPRHFKPVDENTLVTMADGSLRPMKELVVGDRVVSGAGRITAVTGVYHQGELDVVRIVTRTGREVVAERTHRFLTQRGWLEAGDLRPYDRQSWRRPRGDSMVVRYDMQRETRSLGGTHIARLLGYMAGDGCTRGRACGFTNADPEVRATFMDCVRAFGCMPIEISPLQIRVTSPNPPVTREEARARESARGRARRAGEPLPTLPSRRHRLKALLREHGLDDCLAKHKRLPAALLSAPSDEALAFIAAYFECDGNRSRRRANGAAGANSSIASTSRELLEGVRLLLGRVGIRASIVSVRQTYRGAPHISWRLSILDEARFFDLVPVVGAKAGPMRDRSRRYEPSGGAIHDPIVSVTPAGRTRCMCITVADDASFIANDFVTHNSSTAHVWIARLLERFPWMKILYLSYSVTFATENSAAIFDLASKAGVRFGKVQRQDRWTTAEGGGLWSASFDSPLTGRGFHLIAIDDPHQNRAEAESAITRAKVNRSVQADVLSRGQPDGPKAWPPGFPGTSVVVFATRWHEDDVTGNLVGTSPNAKPDAPRFEYINLPAIDDEGRALAPDYWTLEALLEIKARTLEPDWQSLYQGRPMPAGGRLFGDVVLIEPSAIPREGRFAIGVDLSHTAKERSDPHAACAMQRTGDEFFIRDVRSRQARLTSEERGSGDTYRYVPGFVQDIRAMQRTYPGARTAQHVGGPEDFVLELLRSLEEAERVYVEAIRAKVGKRERALRFIHDWNHGRVKLPIGAEWVPGFVSKVIAFTGEKGGQDDEVDAAVTAHTLLTESDGLAVITSSSGGGASSSYREPARGSRRRGGFVW